MTATAGVLGYGAVLTVNGAAVAENQNFSLSLARDMVDMTNRDSTYWRQILPAIRNFTISGDGLYIYNNLAKKILVNHYSTASPATLTVIFTFADGAVTATAEMYLSRLDFPSPHAGPATITFTLEGTDGLELSAS